MKSIIFDLDNTLYSEIEYVKSGFRYVASYLGNKYDLNEEEIFQELVNLFEKQGRGNIFDKLLEDLGLYSDDNVLLLVYLYRSHIPKITLCDDVLILFNKLKELGIQVGIITDGRALVQKNKVHALDLEQHVDLIIYTDSLGFENWKPSIVPYQIALELLNSSPDESLYVGDDPYKDFQGPKVLGIKTIQIKRGKEETYWAERGYPKTNANYEVKKLEEILNFIE